MAWGCDGRQAIVAGLVQGPDIAAAQLCRTLSVIVGVGGIACVCMCAACLLLRGQRPACTIAPTPLHAIDNGQDHPIISTTCKAGCLKPVIKQSAHACTRPRTAEAESAVTHASQHGNRHWWVTSTSKVW